MRLLPLLLLLLSSTLYGQVTVTTPNAVTGLTDTEKVGDYLLVHGLAQPVLSPIGLIRLDTAIPGIKVKVTDINRSPVPVIKVDDKTYIVSQPGRLWYRVSGFDFDTKTFIDEDGEFTIGPPPPPPEPPAPPTPPVPPDAFDNIGQRVAQWTASLSGNNAVGQVYLRHAQLLRASPSLTTNDISLQLKNELALLPVWTTYTQFAKNINADLTTRWNIAPMSKGVLADYYTCIALGLGVKP